MHTGKLVVIGPINVQKVLPRLVARPNAMHMCNNNFDQSKCVAFWYPVKSHETSIIITSVSRAEPKQQSELWSL